MRADDVTETAEIVKIAKASTRLRISLAHKRDRTAITSPRCPDNARGPKTRGSFGRPGGVPGALPMGSARDLETAKADFKAALEALKARTTPEQLLAAYRDLNIRDG